MCLRARTGVRTHDSLDSGHVLINVVDVIVVVVVVVVVVNVMLVHSGEAGGL
jgi:hypothetical protein